jgi:trk system potassium uptake protein TrkH
MEHRLRHADRAVDSRPPGRPGHAALDVARFVGALGLGCLGLVAVDAPGTFLGPADSLTLTSRIIGSMLVIGGAVVLAVWWRRPAAARPVSAVMLASVIGAFVPALPTDPVLAGLVTGWLLLQILHALMPSPRGQPDLVSEGTNPSSPWIREHGGAVRHLASMGILLIVLTAGYRIGDRSLAFLACLVVNATAMVWSAPFVRTVWKHGGRWPLLSGVAILGAMIGASTPVRSLAFLAAAELPILAVLVLRTSVAAELVGFFLDRPATLVAASFLVLIGVGTLFLSFPVSGAAQVPLTPTQALFTATSAACVTGLVVVDTGTALSPFGQGIVLVLIQSGGLSIMVLSAFAAMLFGKRLGIRGELALGRALDQEAHRSAVRLARFIVVSTLSLETAGAIGLFVANHGGVADLPSRLWWSVFHSVSAFCNAGFALQADSLVGASANGAVLAILALLITIGGLGFPVLANLMSRVAGRRRRPLDLHTRLVLTIAVALAGGGALWFLIVERAGALAGMGFPNAVWNALFQSVTLRTAGFNSVDFQTLGPATVLVVMVFMFIGAAPGGTGGGIKTTTAAVLMGFIPALLRRRQTIVLMERAIAMETVFRSAAIAMIAAFGVGLGTVVLLASQPNLPFPAVLFEAVSAFGTVGLSLGVTQQLNTFGVGVVAVLMFVGRIGPLTLVLLLAGHRPSRVGYPETRIMVG